jgi:hypothetical protein
VSESGVRRVAFVGAGDLAEIAYLGVQEWGLELVAVYDSASGGQFMGLTVEPLARISSCDVPAILVCTYDAGEPMAHGYLPDGVERSERMRWFF